MKGMPSGGDRVEAEIKARLSDPDAFRARLRREGATREGSAKQVDTYFQHPARSFKDTDEALRIRQEADDAWLTYKGPKLDAETKSRREIKVSIGDAEAAARMLEALGFQPVPRVEKQRERFRLEDATVTVDHVEGLGWFAELETVVPADELASAREALLALADALGLEDQERRSYLELVIANESEA